MLLYPTVSDYWNSFHSSRAIASYAQQVADLDNDFYDRLWADAQRYNDGLTAKTDRYVMTDEERAEYEGLLNVSGNGINTHRLLVRGHRVENQEEAKTVRVTADAIQIEPVIVAPLVAVPMLLILLIMLLVKTRRKKEEGI